MSNVFYKLFEEVESKVLTLYHISNKKFNKFNPYLMGQGVVWFAKDKEHLITDLHGASVGTGPVYLYTCKVLTNKTAGWDEYEKIGIGELIRSGYDSVELEDDVVCLEPKNIKILQRKQIK